jgi:hypothetical protein
MAAGLPPPWSVETVCFTLGIRGSYAEAQWATSLAALDVSQAGVVDLMTTLVPLCLIELDGLYKIPQHNTAAEVRFIIPH